MRREWNYVAGILALLIAVYAASLFAGLWMPSIDTAMLEQAQRRLEPLIGLMIGWIGKMLNMPDPTIATEPKP